MSLKLKRPLIIFDCETTGVNSAEDRIIEISVIKILPDLSETITTRRLNPCMPIPAQASEVHGITDEMVKDCPTFADVAKALFNLIDGCDILGYNSNRFDVPLLYNEFARAGITWELSGVSLLDAGNIFKIKEERTLAAASRFYLQEELEDSHSAESDAICTKRVFLAQLEKYEDIGSNTIEELAFISNFSKNRADVNGKFVIDDNGDYVINFSKNKGKLAKDELGFLNWMLNCNPPFPADANEIARTILAKHSHVDAPEIVLTELPFK